MLLELHAKNLAPIEKADVEFGEGLNVLTGETGTGKSIIIGSVTMALSDKAPKGSIRPGAGYIHIELVFSVTGEEKRKTLRELEMESIEDGLVVISRKPTPDRSISRINDETVTMARLSQTAGLLSDIRGQYEHQSLFYKSEHLGTLDAYVKTAAQPVKQIIIGRYRMYRSPEEELRGFDLGVESRIREVDFPRFETEEVEASNLKEGEEEELIPTYRRHPHLRRIVECLGAVCEAVEGEWPSRALKEVGQAAEYDETLGGIRGQPHDADSTLGSAGREMPIYPDSMETDKETLRKTKERLDPVYNPQIKYRTTAETVRQRLEQEKKRLEELEDHDIHRERMKQELEECRDGLERFYAQLTGVREKASGPLVKKIRQGLADLNFLDVGFDVEFEKLDHLIPSGWDRAQFLISINPGQSTRPLKDAASGGELFRIILVIKAMLADSDNVPTLIFDEIDASISGHTAQKVSEGLTLIAGSHQITCTAHLSQVAAMADSHFEITKSVSQGRTITTIRLLDRKASIEELARLLGSVRITETVLRNAGEMKKLAGRTE